MTVYLDHAATAPMSRAVLDAMWPYLTVEFANAASQHEAGRRAAVGLQAAREVVAGVLGCRTGEVVFTSGGTESDNLAIKGVALARPRGRHVVTSAVEHDAVRQACLFLQRYHGFEITVLPVDAGGLVDPDAVAAVLRPDSTLCTIQYANNEVGTVQPIAEIAAACSAAGVPLHTDAVQAPGQLPCAGTGADLLSISGHKFGGPKATGVLVVRHGIPLEPLIHGGGQESGARSGTSNVPGAVGLAAALHLAEQRRPELAPRLAARRDRLVDGVLAGGRALLTGDRQRRLPGHASFCFPGRSGESVLLDLESRGFACSSGSACAAGKQEPSPVLLAMGYDPATATTAVRFSIGSENTDAELADLLAAVREILD